MHTLIRLNVTISFTPFIIVLAIHLDTVVLYKNSNYSDCGRLMPAPFVLL